MVSNGGVEDEERGTMVSNVSRSYASLILITLMSIFLHNSSLPLSLSN